ncbi:MAG TPA: hypothetical protein VJT49_18700 [Amycolatopsis sp.]|uniref:hypothetical protein n=1 Tax=Amycolatopsis sp. TaxID=37632 RepID=UPI002B45CB21|nr:hypothetical protein [Amycolatopsis sp.]HKS47096.1 hypothetical protein [Amycolatopsis sp.]
MITIVFHYLALVLLEVEAIRHVQRLRPAMSPYLHTSGTPRPSRLDLDKTDVEQVAVATCGRRTVLPE